MKIFLKVILLLILIGISIGLLLIGKGYDMYKEAIQETPLEEKSRRNKVKSKLYKNFRVATNVFRCSYFCRGP